MALPTITHLEAATVLFPLGDLQSGLAGQEQNATPTSVEWTDVSDNKVVFTGTFEVFGGFVQRGTVASLEVFHGTTAVMTGSGYSLSYDQILKAADAAAADDYTIFYPTFFSRVREIGSVGKDYMYGSTDAGRFLGRGGGDNLYGGPGKEVMNGGGGDDWIEGRGKRDTLIGNTGADTFALTAVDNLGAAHRIKDFSPSEDMFFLDLGRFEAIMAGALDETEFGIGGRAETPDEHFVYKKENGALFYDEDGSGDIAKVHIAHLSPGLKLTAANFEADFVA